MSPRKPPPSVTEPVLVLDLGASSLRVALVVDRRPQVLSFPTEGGRVPMVFGFDPQRPEAGLVVGDAARRLAITEPRTQLFGGLRLAGLRHELAGIDGDHWRMVAVERGLGGDVQVCLGGEPWPVPRLIAALIQSVVEQIQREHDVVFERAVIAVAPSSDDARRRAVIQALRIAGFDQIELIHSTTAAALAWSTLEREGTAALGIAGLEAALAGAKPSVLDDEDESSEDGDGDDDDDGDDGDDDDDKAEAEAEAEAEAAVEDAAPAADDSTGADEAGEADDTSDDSDADEQPDKREQLLLILDLGASTFAAALARIDGDNLEILASRSLARGGDELDERIVDWLLGQFEDANEVDLSADATVRARMRDVAEKTKIALSDAERHEIRLPFVWADASGPKHLFTSLERDRFERMIHDVVEATATLTRSVLGDAGVDADELDAVVMLGGSARVPIIQDRIETLLGRVPETELGTAALDEDFIVRGVALDVVRRGARRPSASLIDIAGRELWLHVDGEEPQRVLERNAARPLVRSLALPREGDAALSFELFEADDDEHTPCLRALIHGEAKRTTLRIGLDADGCVTAQVEPASLNLTLSQRVGLSARAVERLRREAGERARLALARQRHEALRRHLQALMRINEGWLADEKAGVDELLRTSLTQWTRDAEAALEHGEDELLLLGIEGFDSLRDAVPNKLRARTDFPELPRVAAQRDTDETELEPLGDPADDYDAHERVDMLDDDDDAAADDEPLDDDEPDDVPLDDVNDDNDAEPLDEPADDFTDESLDDTGDDLTINSPDEPADPPADDPAGEPAIAEPEAAAADTPNSENQSIEHAASAVSESDDPILDQ